MEPKTATFAELLNSWSTFGTFLIAVGSLIVATIALIRTFRSERPYGVLSIEPTNAKYLQASLCVRNPSPRAIRMERLYLSPMDFRWAKMPVEGQTTIEFHVLFIAYPDGQVVIEPGKSIETKFLIHQQTHSRKRTVEVTAHYYTVDSKPKWRKLAAFATIP